MGEVSAPEACLWVRYEPLRSALCGDACARSNEGFHAALRFRHMLDKRPPVIFICAVPWSLECECHPHFECRAMAP